MLLAKLGLFGPGNPDYIFVLRLRPKSQRLEHLGDRKTRLKETILHSE